MSRPFSIERRTLLKSAGVAIALPWLEAMRTAAYGRTHGTAGPPRRMVLINVNLGLYAPAFFPSQAGKHVEASEYLRMLHDFRDDYTVFSGLSNPDVVGGHHAQERIFNGTPSDQKMGISLDQFAARFLGDFTRFATLPLGMGLTKHSWSAKGTLVPAETRMSAVFQQLFVDDARSTNDVAKKGMDRSRSILDLLHGQAERLATKVSNTDRRKLDEFFTSIREVERRLDKSELWLDTSKPKVAGKPPIDPPLDSEFITRMRNIFDIAFLALKTDSTRIVTFNLQQHNAVKVAGVNNGYHSLSHHGNDPENISQLKLIELEIIKHLRDFLGRLKSTQEDDGNLLQRTMVLLVSNLGNASNHSTNSLPVLLTGGRFKHGQHLVFDPPDATPLGNLYVSMLQQLGIEADAFSTSKGSLNGLELS